MDFFISSADIGTYFHELHGTDQNMKTKKQNCLLRAGTPGKSNIDQPVDLHTRNAFRNLRLNAEDLALGLAARLRVLAKSLAAGCQGAENPTARKNLAYKALRLQLDDFMGHFIDRGTSEHHCFPVVRDYLLEFLPLELRGCSGNPCWLDQVERVISLLSESVCEIDEIWRETLPSFSL